MAYHFQNYATIVTGWHSSAWASIPVSHLSGNTLDVTGSVTFLYDHNVFPVKLNDPIFGVCEIVSLLRRAFGPSLGRDLLLGTSWKILKKQFAS